MRKLKFLKFTLGNDSDGRKRASPSPRHSQIVGSKYQPAFEMTRYGSLAVARSLPLAEMNRCLKSVAALGKGQARRKVKSRDIDAFIDRLEYANAFVYSDLKKGRPSIPAKQRKDGRRNRGPRAQARKITSNPVADGFLIKWWAQQGLNL